MIEIEDVAALEPDRLSKGRIGRRERVRISGADRDRVGLGNRFDADRLDDEIAELLARVGRSEERGIARWERAVAAVPDSEIPKMVERRRAFEHALMEAQSREPVQ